MRFALFGGSPPPSPGTPKPPPFPRYTSGLFCGRKRTINARPYSGSSRRRPLRPPRAAPSILFRDCGRGRGVPRCEHSEQCGFRRGQGGIWGVARSAVRGGPGFPENELVEFLGVHGWETPNEICTAYRLAPPSDFLILNQTYTLSPSARTGCNPRRSGSSHAP